MAKKTVKKPVKKPVAKTPPDVKKEQPKVEKLFEKVPYKEVVEIDASKAKTLDFEVPESRGKMLLKCFGDKELQLGKGTDGNVIHCKGETHAALEFFEIWQLMSICKL